MADIELLKRLAEAAKADGEWFEEGCALYSYYEKVDADFIVAASPDVVLELIAENEALKVRLKLLTIPKEEGPPEIPPHLHGLADAIFTMTENGEDPSDMLAMLDAGMKKAYKATAQIGPKWDDDKTQIVNAMCMTWRHDFGLLKRPGQHRLSSGMTEEEREALRQQMGQLYEHHVAPLLYEARRQILRAADQEQAARYWKKRFDEDTTEAIDQLKAENEALKAQVSTLQSDENSYQSGYNRGREVGTKTRLSEIDQLKAELERVKYKNASFSYHMRDFAFRLGAGGYNAPEVDPDVFASKIHGGIDMMERVRADAERYQWARRPESGNALFTMVSIGECGPNMDAAIDAAMGKGGKADG